VFVDGEKIKTLAERFRRSKSDRAYYDAGYPF